MKYLTLGTKHIPITPHTDSWLEHRIRQTPSTVEAALLKALRKKLHRALQAQKEN